MFAAGLDFDRITPEGYVCPVCNRVHPVYRTVNEMAYDCTVLALQRMTRDSTLQSELLLPDEAGFPYAEMELDAALALAEEALSLVPEIKGMIEPLLDRAASASDVYDAIQKANTYWRQHSYLKGTASKFEDAITLAIGTGVRHVTDWTAIAETYRNQMRDGMSRSAKYYSNEYFNRMVMPALENAVQQAVTGDTAGGKASYRLVREVLDARLKSVPYWHLIAAGAASRAFHYGMVRGGISAGYTKYVFTAVLDFRTSDICRHMDGTTWNLSDAASIMDRVATAQSPEDVASIQPWVTLKDIKGLSNDELRQLGVIVPPLHPFCRSSIEISA